MKSKEDKIKDALRDLVRQIPPIEIVDISDVEDDPIQIRILAPEFGGHIIDDNEEQRCTLLDTFEVNGHEYRVYRTNMSKDNFAFEVASSDCIFDTSDEYSVGQVLNINKF